MDTYEEPRLPIRNMEPPDEEEDDTPRCLYCREELPKSVAMADEYCSQTCAYNDGMRDERRNVHRRLANVRQARGSLAAALSHERELTQQLIALEQKRSLQEAAGNQDDAAQTSTAIATLLHDAMPRSAGTICARARLLVIALESVR